MGVTGGLRRCVKVLRTMTNRRPRPGGPGLEPFARRTGREVASGGEAAWASEGSIRSRRLHRRRRGRHPGRTDGVPERGPRALPAPPEDLVVGTRGPLTVRV